ncbi:hypothetical protein SynMEDNS5_01362 [Synechococcus sp. MEDNS5]|nr:hypothetical protein SynMEDNS5_01362 [Synechococcus sp. MEDNS5]
MNSGALILLDRQLPKLAHPANHRLQISKKITVIIITLCLPCLDR